MKKTLCLLAMTMMLIVGMTVNANAGMTIDFAILGGGTINQTATTITGTDIPVYAVIATGTHNDGKFEFNAGSGDIPIDVFLNFEATLGAAGGTIAVSSPSFSDPFLEGSFVATPFGPFVTPPF